MSSLKEFTLRQKTDIKDITEKMLLLIKLCQKLPPETLNVLELYYLQQKTIKEIALILGKSMTVIRNHRNRGLFILKQYYEQNENN